MSGAVAGPDGRLRCPWALSAPEYIDYHDTEWGRRLTTDQAMFERLTLEAFQSGLSWLIILRKRDGFRKAFADFDLEAVAGYGVADVERLLGDAGIVRNRAKIEASIGNAQAALALDGGLLRHVTKAAPRGRRKAPRTLGEVPAESPESQALAKDLRKRGFRFVGPTTLYALFQATGLVNDHLADCSAR
ncbi:MAG: DNA-3-methyladenine glycosylase [Frankiaceae bacterium]|nr:DNA-3-methyladenine glycosylase [Frankiaceae bacterium]